jgi:hypothetical protein
MIETINAWLGLKIPAWLVAIILGWLLAIGVTQALKFFIPLGWHEQVRHTAAQLIALLTGFCTVWLLQPAGPELTAVLAILTGLWAPFSWALLMAWLKKKHPDVADILSQDVRGVLFGQRRGSREGLP